MVWYKDPPTTLDIPELQALLDKSKQEANTKAFAVLKELNTTSAILTEALQSGWDVIGTRSGNPMFPRSLLDDAILAEDGRTQMNTLYERMATLDAELIQVQHLGYQILQMEAELRGPKNKGRVGFYVVEDDVTILSRFKSKR